MVDAQDTLKWLAGRHHQVRPDRKIAQHLLRLEDLDGRLRGLIKIQLAQRAQRLSSLSARLQSKSPQHALLRTASSLERSSQQLNQAMSRHLEHLKSRLALASAKLNSVGPQATLERGYAIVMRDSRLVTDAALLSSQDAISVRLAKGTADAIVTATSEDSSKK